MTSTTNDAFDRRGVLLSGFLPAALFAIGEGAIIPIIPIAADSLGASLAFAGFVAALILVGELIGDVPSGVVVGRIGERNAMIGAAVVSVVGLLVCVVSPSPWVLAVGVFLVGVSTAVFALARHAYMTTAIPLRIRARALSSLGGVFRFGYFVGPFLSAGVVHLTGTTQSAFWIHVVCCLAAAVVLLVLRDPATGARGLRLPSRASRPDTTSATDGTDATRGPDAADAARRTAPARHPDEPPTDTGAQFVEREAHGLFRTIRENRAVLARLGSGAALIGALRAGRQVILPLWAVSVGLDDASAALVIGIAGAVDFALFYTSGQIMDRWGRLASALPCMLGLAVSYFLLAWSGHLDARVGWFVGIAIGMSLANGVGSGILMTLGADLAPRGNPAPFLGAWRFTGDFGSAAAPLLISGVTAVASLALASGVMGVLGLVGAGVLLRYVPRYLPRRLR
ncbi:MULTISPECIES: MFS transporter [unclassified Curtobacterium]|jgi:MFS family permease|uniref:MFS transporter n=1 Tax=unclassified Curtobacterium TaxID=257496 RepID=UPI00052A1764|nr:MULTISPECIES: MFS transporter [unclassified Curtobacterium]AIV39668.1 major facilitator transporter [Curtobacterium sp. MR_MD2014]MCM3520801.1 MFS transporter [Curtobacterium sp. P97]MDT0210742.1 MFS transporter [Curtobacterium sp. BRD11]